MKHNATPQDIVDMEFDVITIAGKAKDGRSFSPVNPHATLIACKGKENDMQEQAKPSFFQRIGSAFKGLFSEEARKGYFNEFTPPDYKYPVADGLVADDIDNDDDAADDYNAIYYALSCVGYDLANASSISDEKSRAESVKAIIDAFLADLKAFVGNDDMAAKAGKRHSKADQEHVDAIAAHAKALGANMTSDDASKAQASTAASASGTESTTEGEPQMTEDAVKALVTEEVTNAVKAAVEPLNAKIAEQATELTTATAAVQEAKDAATKAQADAEKAVADAQQAAEDAKKVAQDALAAQKAAEDALADAVTKARSRKAAGGHEEGGPVDGKAAFTQLVKENPAANVVDAVKVLMHGSPIATPQ